MMLFLKIILLYKHGLITRELKNQTSSYLLEIELIDRLRCSSCEATLEPIYVNKLSSKNVKKEGLIIFYSSIMLYLTIYIIILFCMWIGQNYLNLNKSILEQKIISVILYNLFFGIETMMSILLRFIEKESFFNRIEACVLGILSIIFLTNVFKMSVFTAFFICRMPAIFIFIIKILKNDIYKKISISSILQEYKNIVIYITNLERIPFLLLNIFNAFERKLKFFIFDANIINSVYFNYIKSAESFLGVIIGFLHLPAHLITQKQIFCNNYKKESNLLKSYKTILIFIIVASVIFLFFIFNFSLTFKVIHFLNPNASIKELNDQKLCIQEMLIFEFLNSILRFIDIVNKHYLSKMSKFLYLAFKIVFEITIFYFTNNFISGSKYIFINFFANLLLCIISTSYMIFSYYKYLNNKKSTI